MFHRPVPGLLVLGLTLASSTAGIHPAVVKIDEEGGCSQAQLDSGMYEVVDDECQLKSDGGGYLPEHDPGYGADGAGGLPGDSAGGYNNDHEQCPLYADLNHTAFYQTFSSLRLGCGDGEVRFGTAWYLSSGADSAWQWLKDSPLTVDQLAFGDFDGDGCTDVFRATGHQWLFSRGGARGWERLNTSTKTLTQLRFGDLDGDGRTDVVEVRADEVPTRVSYGGGSTWQDLPEFFLHDAATHGDWNGDGRPDSLLCLDGRYF